ncbi:MAG: GntR family transcriptional regulator [Aliivibrio sp.]|uniref:GntR family transcriptional regulator n=1 Tax=Aliivibrio sp. TaxID=1872443 RepID=UPI001A544075|nr:GntR family transcriptional regulator [Aliivibrio sp.]
MHQWDDKSPIYRQLSDQISSQIRDGDWTEGEALPSVRVVAADLKINHLTVMKSYQLLVDDALVEKRRGQGMFVCAGAVAALKAKERQNFIDVDIPALAEKLTRMEISIEEMNKQLNVLLRGQDE